MHWTYSALWITGFEGSVAENVENTARRCAVEHWLSLYSQKTPHLRSPPPPPPKQNRRSLCGLRQQITTANNRSSGQSGSKESVDAELKHCPSPQSVPTVTPWLVVGGACGWQSNLSTVARKYLCISATTVSLERVFSSRGPTVKASTQNMDMLTFLHFNMNRWCLVFEKVVMLTD